MNRAAIGRDFGLWLLGLAQARSFCWQKWVVVAGGTASVATVGAVSARAIHAVSGTVTAPAEAIADERAKGTPDESTSVRAREELADQGYLAPSTVQALCADIDPAAQRSCTLLSMGATSSTNAGQKSAGMDGPELHVRLESLWPQARQEVLAWQRGQGETLIKVGADAVSSTRDEPAKAHARASITPGHTGATTSRRPRAAVAGLRFVEKGSDHLHLILSAGATFQGQVVRSNGGQEIRVIAPLRAETRTWLSQRPRMRDVEVTHVRSGEQAVVVGLRVDPSWQVEKLQPTAQGAVLSFRAAK